MRAPVVQGRTLARACLLAVVSFTFVWLLLGGNITNRADDESDLDFWRALFVEATYQTYDSPEASVAASDAVIVGRITGASLAREVNAVPEWGVDGILTFARVEVKVEQVIAGDVGQSDTLVWEAFVPIPGELSTVQGSVPEEPVLMFLRAKDGRSPYGEIMYDLINPESYLIDDAGVVRSALGGVQAWSSNWNGRSFGALVSTIIRARTAAS